MDLPEHMAPNVIVDLSGKCVMTYNVDVSVTHTACTYKLLLHICSSSELLDLNVISCTS